MVEADHGYSILVVVLVDGELALRARVPDLDIPIEGASDDLSVISGQSDRKDVFLVANKLGDSPTCGDVPETNSAIPRGRESEAGVTGELDFADEVGMACHHLSGHAPGLILVFITDWVESPLDKCLVTGSREKEFLSLSINLFFTNGEGSNPSTVTYSINATN